MYLKMVCGEVTLGPMQEKKIRLDSDIDAAVGRSSRPRLNSIASGNLAVTSQEACWLSQSARKIEAVP